MAFLLRVFAVLVAAVTDAESATLEAGGVLCTWAKEQVILHTKNKRLTVVFIIINDLGDRLLPEQKV